MAKLMLPINVSFLYRFNQLQQHIFWFRRENQKLRDLLLEFMQGYFMLERENSHLKRVIAEMQKTEADKEYLQ